MSMWDSFEIKGMDSLADHIRESNEEDEDEEEIEVNLREALLRDMWLRQGINVEELDPNCTFYRYAADKAVNEGRLIVPQPSRDGNFENHSNPPYVTAYTIPPMYCTVNKWVVSEGLPPLS